MYSQNGEDDVVLAAIARMFKAGARESRVFLDVGANDGETLSNTKALVELGWSGAYVEADKSAAGKLRGFLGDPRRRYPPTRYCLLEACVAPVCLLLELAGATFQAAEDSLVSSIVPANVRKWQAKTAFRLQPSTKLVSTEYLLGWLCGVGLDAPSVVSIDVEGCSFGVWGDLVAGGLKPSVWIVEHDGQVETMTRWAAHAKYDVVEQNAENVVMVKR